MDGNLQMVFDEMKRSYPTKQIYVQMSAKKISIDVLKNLWLMRDASVVLVDDYFLAAYLVKPRKQTQIIQMWHATGAFKKFGLSTRNTLFGPSEQYLKIVPIHSNYTSVYVSTDVSAMYFAEAFGMDREQIFAMGTPRAEQLLNGVPAQPKPFTEQQQHMTKILIAPTYRAGSIQQESQMIWEEEIHDLLESLPEHILLIIVLHPYADRSAWIRYQNHPQVILDLESSANAWMAGVDAFITDYSSALFEFALFHKPLANYIPDFQEYTKNRGLYRPIEEITDGALLYNRQDLKRWIAERVPNEVFDTSRMVRENIGETAEVTQKIVQHIFTSK